MQLIRLTATAAIDLAIPFTTVDSTNVQTRLLSTDIPNGSIVVYVKKPNVASAVAGTGSFVATDDTNAKGVRQYVPSSADLAEGVCTFIFTGTSGGKTMEPREVAVQVINDDPYKLQRYGQAVTGTLTATAFTTNLPETTNDYWKDALIRFTSGALAGQVKKIGAYNGTTKLVTLATGLTFTAAPANTDTFELITR